MNESESQQLVHETMELIGSAPPAMLHEDAPVLDDAVVSGQQGGMYLVGLIGGKEVGKSALVNALVGASITPQTSHGPGTETVIAYAHQSHKAEIDALLSCEVPGKYRIVIHKNDRLARQVLLESAGYRQPICRTCRADAKDAPLHALSNLDAEHRKIRRCAATKSVGQSRCR